MKEALSESTDDKNAEIVRKLIEHENVLQNYRFTWLTTVQGLLFASLGFVWEKGTLPLICVLAGLGIVISLSALSALRLSDLAYGHLHQWWAENLPNYMGPPKHGFEVSSAGRLTQAFLPSRIVPRAFLVAWLAVLVLRLLK